MPIETQIIRNKKPVLVGGWTWWHINTLAKWIEKEDPQWPLFFGFPNKSPYVFKEDHVEETNEGAVYTGGENFDPEREYKFEVKAGDAYHAYRVSK